MAIPDAPAGWSRFTVKSALGMGRDFSVLNASGEQVYAIDGKLGVRPQAEVRDSAGTPLYRVTGAVIAIPKRLSITDPSGAQVAELHAKAFSPIKTKMTLTVSGGEPWALEGSFLEKDYAVTSAAGPIVQITQKWVTVRDSYTMDVADGVDPALALALLWAVDRWVERD